jgi:hypothetical protein
MSHISQNNRGGARVLGVLKNSVPDQSCHYNYIKILSSTKTTFQKELAIDA